MVILFAEFEFVSSDSSDSVYACVWDPLGVGSVGKVQFE